jgi:hypothetical protein
MFSRRSQEQLDSSAVLTVRAFSNYDAANMQQRAALHSLSPYAASYNENKVVYKLTIYKF